MPRSADLTGQKFGRLTVVRKTLDSHWLCQCDCGVEKEVRSTLLRSGKTKSCGCYRIERGRAHGASIKLRHGQGRGRGTPEYNCWGQMLHRCRNPNSRMFKNYGGRGITVCERWHTFDNFFADMGPRPSPKHSIDRIDVNGNYEPGNVRWATSIEQNRNLRTNKRITINGEVKTLAEWLRFYGVSSVTYYRRLREGMTEEAALTTPVLPRGRRVSAGTP